MALPHSLNIFDYPARFQFGEQGAPCQGKSCCTDTCIKMIVEYYKERTYSLADIRRVAQSVYHYDERPCTGLNSDEVLVALDKLGVKHYRAGFGVAASDVWNYLSVGPVIVGVYYGSYPDWKGKCNTSTNAEVAGKTDCPFRGAHAVLAVGKRIHTVNGVSHHDIFVRDPDHHSASRPEKPDFDRITQGQLSKAMRDIVPNTAFKNTYIIYPTRKKTL